MKNIYVGNLDYNINEDELRGAFETYGQVDNVTIMRDRDTGQPRGFGFVTTAPHASRILQAAEPRSRYDF